MPCVRAEKKEKENCCEVMNNIEWDDGLPASMNNGRLIHYRQQARTTHQLEKADMRRRKRFRSFETHFERALKSDKKSKQLRGH